MEIRTGLKVRFHNQTETRVIGAKTGERHETWGLGEHYKIVGYRINTRTPMRTLDGVMDIRDMTGFYKRRPELRQ
jgi:hypothetical protein